MFLATLFGFWVDLNLLVNGFVLEKRKPEPPTLQQIITHICNTVSLSNTSLHYEKYHQPVRTQMCEFIELYCINCIFTLFIRCFNKINLYIYTGYTQRMVRFQKVTRNLFLTLHGHNVHRQQRKLSKFLMRYQQFASHA